jgi:ubiquitin-like protein Pup
VSDVTPEEDDVSQSREHHTARPDDEPEVPAAPAPSAHKEALDADVDALLDEIDDVLEENAEEFVRGFVQNGGQ